MSVDFGLLALGGLVLLGVAGKNPTNGAGFDSTGSVVVKAIKLLDGQSIVDESGSATLQNLSVPGATSTTTLSVTGSATLGSAIVNGDTGMNGKLTVTGSTSMSTLSVTGSATLGSVIVNGDVSMDGKLAVTGATSMSVASITGELDVSSLVVTSAVKIADGSQSPGYVLTSDAGGKATWQATTTPLGLPATILVSSSGNNSTATVGGSPFKTIYAALTAAATATKPVTVLVLPGAYPETQWPLVIPPSVTVMAMAFGTVTISALATTSGSFIQMQGDNSMLRNFVVNFQTQSSPSGLNLTGVSATKAGQIANSIIAVVEGNGNAGGGNITGISISGGDGSYGTFGVQDTIVEVVSIGTGGTQVGITCGGLGQTTVNGCDVLMVSSGSPAAVIGFQTTAGTHYARSCTFNGGSSGNDVLQSGGTMFLENCNLINSTSGSAGFSCIGATKMLTFGVISPTKSATQGLYPGGGASLSSSSPFPEILIPETVIVRGISVTSATAPGTGITDTYSLIVGSTSSSVIAASLSNSSKSVSVIGSVSQTVSAGSLIGVQLVSGATAATNIIVTLFLY